MARKNKVLNSAKKDKRDNFYTMMTDIEKEMVYYRDHFKDKIILCNCDDPTSSNFWRYFHLNFEFLGLKKLVSAHYSETGSTYKMEYCGGDDNNIEAGIQSPLQGNGDFRSEECLKLLKEADIVVTNPPFSLFREYVSKLVEYDKKFIILGNQNSITHKEIFPLIQENKIWFGMSIHSGDRMFYIPDDYPFTSKNCGVDKNGKRFARVTGVRWFTNLDIPQRHEELDLVEHYSSDKYPMYDGYEAINVNKTLDIPCDYYGIMGVPITFFDKYCPEQFEILGIFNSGNSSWDFAKPIINGKGKYKRLAIRRIS